MKAYLMAALLLMSAALRAQSYIPFIDTSATWQDEDAWYNMGPNAGNYQCNRYYIGGDTLLNDTAYRVLLVTGNGGSSSQFGSSFFYFSGDTAGWIREDTASRKVYFKPSGWSNAFLFYDFSAGVGPYPVTYRYGSNIEVDSVDTVTLADGSHRRMILNNGDHVVEGIGSLSGFQDYSWGWGGTNWLRQLSCHTASGAPNYEVFSDDCACGANVGVAEQPSAALRIGPSPTDGLCRLEGAPANALVHVLGLDGRAQLSGQCSSDGSLTLDLSPLSPGVYVVVVSDGSTLSTTKVVRE